MARLDTDLLGLQIVSKQDASIVGEIDGLILDEQALTLAGFLVNLSLYEAAVLPFDAARAIGPDAVIIDSTEAITSITRSTRLEELANKEITITDATAITLSGKNVGSAGDFFVDTDSGDLVGLEFFPAEATSYAGQTAVLPASTIHRLGRDIIVLEDDFDQHFLKDEASLERVGRRESQPNPTATAEPVEEQPTAEPQAAEPAVPAPAPEPEPTVEPVEAVEPVTEPEPPAAEEVEQAPELEAISSDAPEAHEDQASTPERFVEEAPVDLAPEPAPEPQADGQTTDEAQAAEAPAGEEPAPGAETPEAADAEPPQVETGQQAETDDPPVEADEDAFTAGQRHFLIGKRVMRKIETPAGDVLASEGDIVDFEMIQKAKSSDLLLILSLNVE